MLVVVGGESTPLREVAVVALDDVAALGVGGIEPDGSSATGLLLHRKGRFTQFLKGDEAEVRALLELTLWFRVRAARPGTPPGNS